MAFVAVVLALSVGAAGGVAQTGTADGGPSGAEPNDSPANAMRLGYGETATAELSTGEEDWYAVDGRAGEALVARLELREAFPGSAIEVDVVAPSGAVSTEMQNDGVDGPPNVAGAERPVDARTGATGVDVMESDDTYYVRVSESRYEETDESAVYEYDLTVATESLDEYDPNENGTTAAHVELGRTVEAVVTGYDSDVFAVDVTAGRSYNVTVDTAGVDTLEKQLTVYDAAADAVDDPDSRPNGTPVAHDDDPFFEGTVSFTATENGTYYVQLVESSVNPSLFRRSNYSLTVNGTGAPPATGEKPLPADGDADLDGLTNARELELGTAPEDADTDDGLTDGCELRNDADPRDPDNDGGGTPDGGEV